MAFIGRLHPLLIHFPIAPVVAAALAEVAVMVTADERWRTVAVANVRAGAVFGSLPTITGWCGSGARNGGVAAHRMASVAGNRSRRGGGWGCARDGRRSRAFGAGDADFRTALFAAGTLVAVTGHFGGLLVWGANCLHP